MLHQRSQEKETGAGGGRELKIAYISLDHKSKLDKLGSNQIE